MRPDAPMHPKIVDIDPAGSGRTDLDLLHEIGSRIANSNAWPTWYKGNEFRSIREKSLRGK